MDAEEKEQPRGNEICTLTRHHSTGVVQLHDLHIFFALLHKRQELINLYMLYMLSYLVFIASKCLVEV